MSVLTMILGGVILAYTILYCIKRLLPIMRFKKELQGENIREIDGYVSAKIAEENKAFQGQMVNICLPKYEYRIGDNVNTLQGAVRYRNLEIGQPAKIMYCERTGEAWAKNDIPLVKKNLIMTMAIMGVILVLLVITDFL